MGDFGHGYQYGHDDFLKWGSGLFEDDGDGECRCRDGREFVVGQGVRGLLYFCGTEHDFCSCFYDIA